MSVQNPPIDSLSPFNPSKFTGYPVLTIPYLNTLYLSSVNSTTSGAPITTFNGTVVLNNQTTSNSGFSVSGILESTTQANFNNVLINGTLDVLQQASFRSVYCDLDTNLSGLSTIIDSATSEIKGVSLTISSGTTNINSATLNIASTTAFTGTNTFSGTSSLFAQTITTRAINPQTNSTYAIGSAGRQYTNLFLQSSIVSNGITIRPTGRIATINPTSFAPPVGAPVVDVPFVLTPVIGNLTIPGNTLILGDQLNIVFTGKMIYGAATSDVVFNITSNGSSIIKMNFKTPITGAPSIVEFSGYANFFIKSNTQSLGSLTIICTPFTGGFPNILYDNAFVASANNSNLTMFNIAPAKTIGMSYTNNYVDAQFAAVINNFTLSIT